MKKQLQLQYQSLFQLLDNHEKKIEINEQKRLWFFELEKVYNQISERSSNTNSNNYQITTNFATYMRDFWGRVIEETNISMFKSNKRRNEEEYHHSKKFHMSN